MRLFEKRVIIPSALLCLLAILYFLLRLFLSGSYVRATVVDALASKFRCNFEIDGATIGLRHLTINGLKLSYRKSQQLHQVAHVGRMVIHFRPHPFFKTGVFDTISIEDAVLAVERDSEGWLTLGRIIGPRATLAAKHFEINVRRLSLRIGGKNIPVKTATVRISNAWPKMSFDLSDVRLLKGRGVGKGWFTVEEDSMLNADLEMKEIDLAEATRAATTGDLALRGFASGALRVLGRASSANLVQHGSCAKVEQLAVGILGKEPILTASEIAFLMDRSRDASQRLALTVNASNAVLNVTPWIHHRDTPDHLLVRDKIESRLRGERASRARVNIRGLRLIYEGIRLPFDAVSCEVQQYGASTVVKDVTGEIAGGSVRAQWEHRQVETTRQYEGRVKFSDLDLRTIVDGTPLRDIDIAGKLSGTLDFATAASASGGVEGNGGIHVGDAKLWQLPVLAAVRRAAGVARHKPGERPSLTATFALDKDMLNFDRIAFIDGNVEISGKGEIYHGGEADLRLRVTSKEYHSRQVPVVDDFIGLLSDAFSTKQQTVRVTGPFTSPRASAVGEPTVTRKAQDRRQ